MDGKMRKKTAAAIAATVVVASGITLATPGLAQAASSCTSYAEYYTASGPTNIPTIGLYQNAPNCQLANGNDSSGVDVLQYTLDNCYGSGLTQDGEFGALTEAAVKHVQSILGISVDGIYGPQTRNAMKWDAGGVCAKLLQPLDWDAPL
jgi:peptidoglycan hydrolase-like protein with peptidoglycan-binding domain